MQRSKGKSIAVKMATEFLALKNVIKKAHKQLELGEYESAKQTLKEVIGE